MSALSDAALLARFGWIPDAAAVAEVDARHHVARMRADLSAQWARFRAAGGARSLLAGAEMPLGDEMSSRQQTGRANASSPETGAQDASRPPAAPGGRRKPHEHPNHSHLPRAPTAREPRRPVKLPGHPSHHGHHVNTWACGRNQHAGCTGFSGGYDTYRCGCCCHDLSVDPSSVTEAELAWIERVTGRTT